MIKLDTQGYCQDCVDFEPIVIRKPEQFIDGFGNVRYYGDTIVKCVYQPQCEAIYCCSKKEK